MKNYPINLVPLAAIVFLLSMGLTIALRSIQADAGNLPQKKSSNSSEKKIANSDGSGELNDQGQLRTYKLYTPKSYNPNRPMPLVLVFHGSNGTGASIADVTRFNDLAEKKGFIVAYPDGINHNWRVKQVASSPSTPSKVDDVLFVAALIDHLKQTRNIDSRRIYATGFSKGAILTQALACNLPNQIAAFASVEGSLPVTLKDKCQPQIPVSMMMINGTNDQSVHYQGEPPNKKGKGALASIPETIDIWRKLDSCTSPAQVKQLPDPSPSDSLRDSSASRIQVKTSRYTGCNSGSEVMLAAIVDGGHFWPGGATQDPNAIQFNAKLGYNATDAIWDFFQRHTLP